MYLLGHCSPVCRLSRGPLLRLFGKSFWDGDLTFDFYAAVVSKKGFLPALGNSFAVAVASAVLATVIAF